MHTQIDSRQADQKKRRRAEYPHERAKASIFNARGEKCGERAEKAGAAERMSTREAVSFGSRQVKKRSRTSAFEGKFESHVQKRCSNHGGGEKSCLATPFPR